MNANRMLIIDDEPGVRNFIQQVAEDFGFDARSVDSEAAFKEAVSDFQPNVITLDLVMPNCDGIQLLRYLADQKIDAGVILMSGVDQKVLQTAQELGTRQGVHMLGTLQKPLRIDSLEQLFEQGRADASDDQADRLARAIQNGELRVFYQPKANLDVDKKWCIEAAEALVRWQHPQRGLLGPDDFIPLAEEAGLIGKVTDFVLGEVAAQMAAWDTQGLSISVSVNMPPVLLDDLELPDTMATRLSRHGIACDRVVLEVTESGAMEDSASVMDILTRFRLKGFGLSLDDFGTGYSSLIQLYRMPFSELKIDKSFVMDALRSAEAKVIVQTSIQMAKSLGLKVCAEGTEEDDVLAMLREFQCDTAQGYLVSRAIPGDEFGKFLEDHNCKPANAAA